MKVLILWIGLTIAWIFNAWTTPRTWTTGELVTAAIMNTHIRDNLNALFSPVTGVSTITTDITTTSTSFEYATGLSVTLTTAGDTVLAILTGTFGGSASSVSVFLDIHDGSTLLGGTDGLVQWKRGTNAIENNASFSHIVTGLTPGSNTIKIQWKVSSGTGTFHATNQVTTLRIIEVG